MTMNKQASLSSNISYRKWLIYCTTAIAAISGFLFGYDTGVISGAQLYIEQTFILTALLSGIMVSAVPGGALVGAIISGEVSNRFGRRKMLIITGVVFILGSLYAAMAGSLNHLIAARLIIGFAIGIASYTAPLYISELAPKEIRGGLVTINQLAITIGIFAALVVDYLTGTHWRIALGIGIIPAVLLAVGICFLPDSPRWLVMANRPDEAHKVLKELHSSSPEVSEIVETEFQDIRGSLAIENAKVKDLFSPALLKLLFIGIALAIFQQIIGINAIIYYAPKIFQNLGFQTGEKAILASIILTLVNVLMTVLAVYLMDRLGRRTLLLIGNAGMMICLLLLAVLIKSGAHILALDYISLLCILGYISFFAISMGPIFWLLISEIYPLHARSLAMSIATAFNWGANMVVTLTFPILSAKLGISAMMFTFGIACALCLYYCYRRVPETKQRSLEEITKEVLTKKVLV